MRKTYRMRRGKECDFSENILVPGEAAEITDRHTLVFCFGEGDVSYLNVDKTVDEETAKELIFRIRQFIENSYEVGRGNTRSRDIPMKLTTTPDCAACEKPDCTSDCLSFPYGRYVKVRPNCKGHSIVDCGETYKFCPVCGQAIELKGDEEETKEGTWRKIAEQITKQN